MMDFDDDFEFINNNNVKYINTITDHQKDNFDFPIFHSTPAISHTQPPVRSIDYPSMKKHYGIVTFFDYQLPILYRLINDTYYIPYIRFSYVLNIFEHCSHKKYLINIRNLPVIEMTSIERDYYNQLSSLNNSSDWSNDQLLSVSMLDGTLAIMNLLQNFNFKNQLSSIQQFQQALDIIRQEARDQWILDEKIVLTRLAQTKDINSTCISSSNMAKRRSIFEQRLDLSIVNEAGGFIQIDSYIYPFIKNLSNNQIYLNLDDIRQKFNLSSSSMICYRDENSSMYRSYTIVIEQAQSNYDWNIIRRGRNNNLLKYLPSAKRMKENFYEQFSFLPLHLLLKKDSTVQFVQLFETSSLDEIETNYKNHVGREFILTPKRQGGLVNGTIPCLILTQFDQQIIWIPSETKTRRIMSNDERLYLNMILLYHGLWKNILTKKKQWYLKEVDKENVNIEIFFDNEKSRQNKIV